MNMQKTFGKRIHLFDKTKGDIVCPHFYILAWARGCPFQCAWCYLQGTYRIQGKQPHFYPRSEVDHSIKLFNKKVKEPQLLNSGELCDSLMGEHLKPPFTHWILSRVAGVTSLHKVLFLFKMTTVENIVKHSDIYPDTWKKAAIFSWSLNADSVAKRWEHEAPPVKHRIEAARKVAEAGYEVRIRIDPIIPGFITEYWDLIDTFLDSLTPSRITLGSLRGLRSTISAAIDKSWVSYLSEKSDWGLKVPFSTRLTMYSAIINHLRDTHGYRQPIALCKETFDIWDKLRWMLGMRPSECLCNCIL